MAAYPEIFNKCIEVILRSEGGYQCNPSDLGNWSNGKLIGTKYGIAARFFPNENIKMLTIARAKEIYYLNYFLPMNLEGITNPDSVLQIFDMGINAGKVNAIRIAQRLVNVNPDGRLGVISKSAINSFSGFPDAYKTKRIEYYKKCSENPRNAKFLNGWINRVSNTHFT